MFRTIVYTFLSISWKLFKYVHIDIPVRVQIYGMHLNKRTFYHVLFIAIVMILLLFKRKPLNFQIAFKYDAGHSDTFGL